MRTKFFSLLIIFAAITLFVSGLAVATAHAATSCTFTRDLELGAIGEDVRCLQRYLNAEGFTVATEGVGSPGNETNLYREKTKEAVRKWQIAKTISPSTGNWGQLSRALYAKLATTPVITTPPTGTPPVTTPTTPVATSMQEKNARTALLSALNATEEAKDELGNDDDEEVTDLLDEAYMNLFDAMRAFLDRDYSDTLDFADVARDAAKNALDEMGGSNRGSDRDEANEGLDDIEGELEDAEDDIADADDDGEDVEEAEELLEEAWDLFDEAKETYADRDYDEVMDMIDEIEELIDDALDSI
jgi:hypothetical protein